MNGSRLNVHQATLSRWEKEGLPDKGPARLLLRRILEELEKEAAE